MFLSVLQTLRVLHKLFLQKQKPLHCLAFSPLLCYSCAWLIVWGRRIQGHTMQHQCRPIDPHAPSLCPSQLVLQEHRGTVGGGVCSHTQTWSDLHPEYLRSVWERSVGEQRWFLLYWHITAHFPLHFTWFDIRHSAVNTNMCLIDYRSGSIEFLLSPWHFIPAILFLNQDEKEPLTRPGTVMNRVGLPLSLLLQTH